MATVTCPECSRPTIRRVGGEWCRWCIGFIHEVRLVSSEGPSHVRVLRGTR